VTTYTRWYPGPNDVPEYSSGEGLRAAISGSAPVQHLDGSPGGGAPAGIWTMIGWQEAGPAGAPYLQIDANGSGGAAGHFWRGRFRFNAAMLGTVDPSAWFNGTSDPIAGKLGSLLDFTVSYSLHATGQRDYLLGLLTVIKAAGLCHGTIDTNNGAYLFMPAGAPNGGDVYGIHRTTAYDPSVSEYGSGYNPLRYDRIHLGGSGYANLNLSEGNIGIGTSQSTVPVVVVQEGSQETNWNTMVSNQLTNIFNDNKTVINIDDLGEPGQTHQEPDPQDVKVEVFTTGYVTAVVPVAEQGLVVGGTLLGWLARGLIAGSITLYRLLENLPSLWGMISDFTDLLPDLPTASGNDSNAAASTTELERIATALEAILVQTKASNPADGTTLWDQVFETQEQLEAVATSRSEIELQAKGVKVTAHGGVVEEP